MATPSPAQGARTPAGALAQFVAGLRYSELPPEAVEDRGTHWLIKFGSRPGYTGGGPWVEVRKSDLKVLGSVAFQ